jgi:hypothetical protein
VSTTVKKTVLAVAVAATALALAGCGSTGGTAPAAVGTPSSADGTSSANTPTYSPNSPEGRYLADSVKVEQLVANCMKAHGFTYVPHPMTSADLVAPGNLAGRDPALVPYDQLRAYRAKYGFGIFGRDVYPHDPNLSVGTDTTPNPNTAIRAALPAAQQQAYDQALEGDVRSITSAAGTKTARTGGCADQASRQAYAGAETSTNSGQEATARAAEQSFQTNPDLLAAARDYGSCLTRKGYRVTSTKPGAIEHTVEQAVQTLHDQGSLSPTQGLTKEVAMSLDDLECGRDYEARAKPLVQTLLTSGQG